MFKNIRRKSIAKVVEDNLDYFVRFAYYRLKDCAEAEDLVYDAVLRLLERDTSAINPESVRLYLFRIVRNMCMDRLREKGCDTVSVDVVDIADKMESAPDAEEVDRVNACLAGLPLREVEAIRMKVVDGLSFVEISDILSVPASTVKSRYKSGMDKLRNRFINDKTH